MYGISLGSFECPVFYEDTRARTSTFSLAATMDIIKRLLPRKERNNGVGKYLIDVLRLKGACRYDFSKRAEPLGFHCRLYYEWGQQYCEVTLFGSYPHELINRLNGVSQTARAIAVTRAERARRKQLRSLGQYKTLPKRQKPQAFAGDNARLKHHFRNSKITCADAISAITYAGRLEMSSVRTRMIFQLTQNSLASLRLKGGFVFRVDLDAHCRGLLDLLSIVQIRTTNDNTHGAYRRLRSALRKRLKIERKARVIAQKKYLAAKRLEKTTARFAA